MSRNSVSSAFGRLQPELFLAAALGALILGACGSADSSAPPVPATSARITGSAGSGANGAPHDGSGGAPACDVSDAVCVTTCPIGREGVRCDTSDPCPPGYVVSFTCGASGATPSACMGILAREGAFCAKGCPETAPSVCVDGAARCDEGWKLLSTCAS